MIWLISLTICLLAIWGSVEALYRWNKISGERKKLESAKNEFISKEAWEGAFAQSENELLEWIRKKKIDKKSHIADVIRACWSAWLSGVNVSSSELNKILVSSERTERASLVSSLIAGSLLIVGILGTLLSVHPILQTFQLQVTDSGEAQEVAESTARINSLINDLGHAFWPSICALIGTVAVVICRGFYLYELNRFINDLNRFAMTSLTPKYRPSSISQEYSEVKRILSDLSVNISNREQDFASVVKELQNLVEGIKPTVVALNNAAKKSTNAAEKLSGNTKSIAEGIAQNLGSKSPMYKAVSELVGTFERTTTTIESLASVVNSNDEESLVAVVRKLSKQVDTIGTDHAKHKEEVEVLLGQLEKGINKTTKTIADAAREATSQGLQLIKSGVDEFQKENKVTGDKFFEEFRTQTAEKLKELAAVSSEFPRAVEDIRSLIITKSRVEEAALSAIRKQQTDSEAALAKPIEDLKKSASDLAALCISFNDVAEKATSALGKTEKLVENLDNRHDVGYGSSREFNDHESSIVRGHEKWGTSVSEENGKLKLTEPEFGIEDNLTNDRAEHNLGWFSKIFPNFTKMK